MGHAVHTKFQYDRFRGPKAVRGETHTDTLTRRQQGDLISLLIIFNKESKKKCNPYLTENALFHYKKQSVNGCLRK
jgi:hypothetical protein